MIVSIEDLLTNEDIANFRDLLENGTFIDGKLTAGYRAKRVKNNEQISWDDNAAIQIQDRVLEAIESNKRFQSACHPKRISTPLISKSTAGMGYGFHVDDAQIGDVGNKNRSDVSMTIFLSDPHEYEGGELEIITPYGATSFKLPAGHAIIFP